MVRASRACSIGQFAIALMACATQSYPPPYEAALRRAEGLERLNQHAAAADGYAKARAFCARQARLCARVIYREASQRERAGQIERARRLYSGLVRTYPRDREAPRAARFAARIDLRAGRLQLGRSELAEAIVRYAEHGDASAALAELVRSYLDHEGAAAARASLLRLYSRVERTAIGDNVLFEIAQRSVELAEHGEAVRALAQLVELYPYPRGGMWDDALWALADLCESRGDARGAIQWLERMVSVQESSAMVGSYNLARFDDAELRIGRLWLSPLGRPDRAISAAERLLARYPDSVLRDDAIVLEARALVAGGRSAESCALRERLRTLDPFSRFLRPGRWPARCRSED